jgi:hypothetical protein
MMTGHLALPARTGLGRASRRNARLHHAFTDTLVIETVFTASKGDFAYPVEVCDRALIPAADEPVAC